MNAAAATRAADAEPAAPPSWLRTHLPPSIELTPCTRVQLEAWFRGGEPEADECERLLVWACRARGAIDLGIGEGLHALQRGDRLAALGYHLDDYAREVLDLGKRAAESLARLARELCTRPLLREAVRSGRVRLRAAETVLPVATGEAEAEWVERAARSTVRQLEVAVRSAGGDPGEAEEPWYRLRALLRPEEREIVDLGLEIARGVVPGASRMEALEVLSQEFLAEYPTDPEDDAAVLGRAVQRLGPGAQARKAELERETERWSAFAVAGECPVPDVRFDDDATAHEIDRPLRDLCSGPPPRYGRRGGNGSRSRSSGCSRGYPRPRSRHGPPARTRSPASRSGARSRARRNGRCVRPAFCPCRWPGGSPASSPRPFTGSARGWVSASRSGNACRSSPGISRRRGSGSPGAGRAGRSR